jgi:hypothetical protein
VLGALFVPRDVPDVGRNAQLGGLLRGRMLLQLLDDEAHHCGVAVVHQWSLGAVSGLVPHTVGRVHKLSRSNEAACAGHTEELHFLSTRTLKTREVQGLNKTPLRVSLGECLEISVTENHEFHVGSSLNRSQRNYLT